MISSFVFPALTDTSDHAFIRFDAYIYEKQSAIVNHPFASYYRNIGQAIGSVAVNPYVVAGFFVFGAILAVSTIRTFSSKLVLSKEVGLGEVVSSNI